jgi:hypothetical protein
MKVRDLIELLSEEDPHLPVLVPYVRPGVARECVGTKEIDMYVDRENGDYTKGEGKSNVRVIALLSEPREPDKKADEKSDAKD